MGEQKTIRLNRFGAESILTFLLQGAVKHKTIILFYDSNRRLALLLNEIG